MAPRNVSHATLGSPLAEMAVLRDGRSARVSSFDVTGGNADCRPVKPGASLELASLTGAGCIHHIYFTILAEFPGDYRYLRDMVLRAYWDGEGTPSVEVPLGDFFGLGHERIRYFRSLPITVNEGAEIFGGRATSLTIGLNSYFPMPFSNGARLTLTQEGDYTVGAVWYHIDYEGFDELDPAVGRFHAQWRRENPTTAIGSSPNTTTNDAVNLDGAENYVILDAQGRGNFAGYFLNVDNLGGGWYGEGDDMIFLDGEAWPPTMHGTGTEECFGGGACPNTEYAGPYTGFHLVGNKDFSGKVSMYRFHVVDPVRFQSSIRVTLEHGHANNYANDYSSTAFWYQTEPHAPFPPLLPAAQRRPLAGDDPHDKAYRGLFEVQQVLHGVHQLLAKRRMEMPLETKQRVLEELGPAIERGFATRDYAAVAEHCAECRDLLKQVMMSLAD